MFASCGYACSYNRLAAQSQMHHRLSGIRRFHGREFEGGQGRNYGRGSREMVIVGGNCF